MVLAFNFCRLIQNHNFPSFLQTSIKTLAYGMFEGQMAPTSNISWMCAFTSSYIPGGMCLYHSLNGIGSFTLMECLTIDVLPKSKSFWETMQAYPCTRSQASCCNCGSHSSNPDTSSFCKISSELLLPC